MIRGDIGVEPASCQRRGREVKDAGVEPESYAKGGREREVGSDWHRARVLGHAMKPREAGRTRISWHDSIEPTAQ